MGRRVARVGVLLALLVGCRKGGPLDNIPVQPDRARLQSFSDCAALERYVEDTAVQAMETQLESWRDPTFFRGGVRVEMATPLAAGQTNDGPTAYTQTNNQVAGVEEGDIVKNDGTRILALSGQRLYLARSWPAETLAVQGQVDIEGWPSALFLDGTRAAVVSNIFPPIYAPVPAIGDQPLGVTSDSLWAAGWTKVTVFDVSNLAAPAVLSETYLPGSYQAGRQLDHALRLVTSAWFTWPVGVQLYPEWSEVRQDTSAFLVGLDVLQKRNEELIRAQHLDAWFPAASRRLAGGSLETLPFDCSSFAHSGAPSWLGTVSVVTLRLDVLSAPPGVTGLLAYPGVVYASRDNLYVGTAHWWFWPEPGQNAFTYLHQFDITDPLSARYVASGVVEGQVLNQFALDEHQGFLRAATTLRRLVPDPIDPWGRVESSNRVSVLQSGGGFIRTVAATPDVAKGESLFSARFMGPRGYLVTFRQIDPLFTVDLSDPYTPRIVGELKVPGFSTYLHPLDETHLLALGTYVPEDGGWNDSWLQLSMFDVTDFAHPVQSFTQRVGNLYGSSEAAYEHHAFNYFPARGLLAIPYSEYSWGGSGGSDLWAGFVSDLRVFGVSAQTGFTPKGALSMSDLYVQSGAEPYWGMGWSPSVRRSVMADDFVYAISDAGIRVARAESLSSPVATAPFFPIAAP